MQSRVIIKLFLEASPQASFSKTSTMEGIHWHTNCGVLAKICYMQKLPTLKLKYKSASPTPTHPVQLSACLLSAMHNFCLPCLVAICMGMGPY